MGRFRTFAVLLGAAAAAAAIVRHGRGGGTGRAVPGGILIGDTGAYEAMSRLVLGTLFGGIAANVAASVPAGARVLEVGCGPGHLSTRLARHGHDVTGLDLDPAMIDRARTNAHRAGGGEERRPSFVVGDVAALPFPDRSFDVVVSTLSMHHWADPTAGLAEIRRVLRPGAPALIWDLRPGLPFHSQLPDPLEHARGAPLRVVSATPWRWPWRFSIAQRIELVSAAGPPGHSDT
jgi:SAM-dependent methyltransferase